MHPARSLITSSKDNEVTVKAEFSLDEVTLVENKSYTHISLSGAELPDDPAGFPAIPARFINVLIPSGAKVLSVEAFGDEKVIAEDVLLYPIQPQAPSTGNAKGNRFIEPDSSLYNSDSLYPEKPAKLAGVFRMRGYSFASIRLNPVRYLPASRELYLFEKITITLRCDDVGPTVQTLAPRQNRFFRNTVKRLTVNSDMLDVDSSFSPDFALPSAQESSAADVDYIIITSSDLSGAFQALADHRSTRNGFHVEIITLDTLYSNYSGTDEQARIRACIIDYVNNHNCSYVVLGGDNTVVPDRDCYVSVNSSSGLVEENHMPTDLYYAGIDSNWDEDGDGIYGEANTSQGDEGDLAPDVFVGRIPVRTSAQVTAYVNKVISFENNPPTAVLSKVLLIGEHLGASAGYAPYTGNDRPSDAVNDGLLGFGQHGPVSDSEMWSRRMYRDAIVPHWQSNDLGIFFDTITSWDADASGDYAQNITNVSTVFNQSWYHVFMETHGSSTSWGLEIGSFLSGNASSLSGRQYIVYTGACLTGNFDGGSDPCLSEAFLRNATGGSIAFFGCSRYGWYSPDPPRASNTSRGGTSMEFAYTFYEAVLGGHPDSLGEAFYLHKSARAGLSGYNGSNRWVQFGLNFQGDPAIGAESPDDDYEENDTRAAAYDFTAEGTWISSISGPGVQKDDDWYEISVLPDGHEKLHIDCQFTHADGNIDIALYDSSGTLLESSAGTDDNELIEHTVPGSGTFFIRVYGGNAGNTYDLRWEDMPVNHDPELTSGNVSPQNGDAITTFVYTVSFYDADGDAPATRNVVINGAPHPMDLVIGTPDDGTYEFQTTLTPGDYSYYFEFSDGKGGSDRLPDIGSYQAPTVSEPNHAPQLSDGLLSPQNGDAITTFVYTVSFYDADGDSPSTRNVVINGAPHPMDLVIGTADDGKYEFQTTLTPGDYSYYFEFSDGNGGSDRLPDAGTYQGPTIPEPNHAPQLSDGLLSPQNGDAITTFVYTVSFYDADGDSPSTRNVVINGAPHPMDLVIGTADDGKYEFQTTLTPGDYSYYFEFSDGNGGSDRLPDAGTYQGPTIPGNDPNRGFLPSIYRLLLNPEE